MVLPVDMSSYAIGLLSTVSFRDYCLATAIGIVPFSFVFAYIGPALLQKNVKLVGLMVLVSLIILGAGYRVLKKRATHHD